jgi:hypothetical protein
MRSCFQIEEEASKIKSKYGKSGLSKQSSITAADVLNSLPPLKPSLTIQAPTKPLKTLSKPEKLVLAATAHSEDTAEDALLALSLLQQYKRDPSFIQRELKDQAKKREQVLGE